MSKDDCGRHGYKKKAIKYLAIAAGIIGVIVLVFLVVWFVVFRPSKPQFYLQEYTLYSLNFSQPSFLTSQMQVTISTRNPNQNVGLLYLKLNVYATYRNQPITLPTGLPANYLGHKETAVWSPFMYGTSVPVSPLLGNQLTEDLNAGRLLLYVRVAGRLKWKVGTLMYAARSIRANCPAYLNLGGHQVANGDGDGIGGVNGGFAGGFGVKYQFVQHCNVDLY